LHKFGNRLYRSPRLLLQGGEALFYHNTVFLESGMVFSYALQGGEALLEGGILGLRHQNIVAIRDMSRDVRVPGIRSVGILMGYRCHCE